MTLINQGNIPDYLSLYQTVKPLYAYYTILTRRIEKCDNHTFLLGKREMNALLTLAQEIIKLTPHINSLPDNFLTIRFFEDRKCFVMTPVQESAKKRVFSMLELKKADQSALFLRDQLKYRLQIINDLSQSDFALTISKACLKIAHALLFSHWTLTVIRKLGCGSYGTVEKVQLMGQVCARKTLSKPSSTTIKKSKESVLSIIRMANPQVCDVYLTVEESNQIFFEPGFGDFHHIFQTNWERDVSSDLPTYIEDLLRGFSNMHFGLSSIARITSKKKKEPEFIENVTVLFSGHPPVVHGDIKPSNTLLARNSDGYFTAKIIDLDTATDQGETICAPTCTYEFTSPDAAAEYKNPLGFNRKISIYDDSWSLGCTLYRMLFSDYIYINRKLTDLVKVMTTIAALTQKIIDAKLNRPLNPQTVFLLGTQDFQQFLTYLKEKDPARSLRRKDKRELQRKFGEREFKRQTGIMRGLLTVDVKKRLTVDQAHNIYYLSETKLRSEQSVDFDNPVYDMEFECNLFDSNSPTFPLKIEYTVYVIQIAVRKFLQKIHRQRRKHANSTVIPA